MAVGSEEGTHVTGVQELESTTHSYHLAVGCENGEEKTSQMEQVLEVECDFNPVELEIFKRRIKSHRDSSEELESGNTGLRAISILVMWLKSA